MDGWKDGRMDEWADEWRAVGDIGIPGFWIFRLRMTGDCRRRGLRETVAVFRVILTTVSPSSPNDNDDGGIDNQYLSEALTPT